MSVYRIEQTQMNEKTSVQNFATTKRPQFQWRKTLTAYAFLLPYLAFFLVFQLGPFVASIGMSFTEWELLKGTREFAGAENFYMIFTDDLFWLTFRNSIYFGVLTTGAVIVIALAAAHALWRVSRGQTTFRIIFYAPVILSISVIGILWQRILNNNGLINYYLSVFDINVSFLGDANFVIPSLSLTTVWWVFGFPMLILLAGLHTIPESFYEAARIDGANGPHIFFKITLPLLKPSLLLVFLTQFITHMQVFGQPYIMTNGGPGHSSYTAMMYLYQTAWRYYHMGLAAAMAVVMGIFLLIIALTVFRIFGERVEY